MPPRRSVDRIPAPVDQWIALAGQRVRRQAGFSRLHRLVHSPTSCRSAAAASSGSQPAVTALSLSGLPVRLAAVHAGQHHPGNRRHSLLLPFFGITPAALEKLCDEFDVAGEFGGSDAHAHARLLIHDGRCFFLSPGCDPCTLDECIREFMAKPAPMRHLYQSATRFIGGPEAGYSFRKLRELPIKTASRAPGPNSKASAVPSPRRSPDDRAERYRRADPSESRR